MIETARLRLRPWRDADAAEFARVTNVPEVMEHLGGVRPREHFAGMVAKQRALEACSGFCFWVVERLADAALLGFCGLEPVDLPGVPISAEVEIGWRLRRDAWGQDYAREAAAAALDWAWGATELPRVVAMTIPANRRSWGLMERLGMERRPALDFDHPSFPEGDPLRAHIVYCADRPQVSAAGPLAPPPPAPPHPASR